MFYDYLILRFHENISNISKYLSQFLYLVFVPFVDIITFVDKSICDIITLKEFQYCSTTLIFHSCLRLWKGFLFRKNALYTNGFHFLKHQYLVLLREVFHLIFQFSISHRLYYSIFHRIIKTPLDYHHGTPLDKHCYCVKMSKYGVISGPYFPVFGLNTEIYSVNSVRIQENADQK